MLQIVKLQSSQYNCVERNFEFDQLYQKLYSGKRWVNENISYMFSFPTQL